MIIRFEETVCGNWHGSIGPHAVVGETRLEALREARRIHPEYMAFVPLQPEEIPGELREIARRMRAVGDAVLTHEVYQPYHPTAEAMGRWADSVAAWAGNLEDCADGPLA